MTSGDGGYDKAIADLRAAYDRAVEAITGELGDDEAFDHASDARNELERMEEAMADLRATAAYKIQQRRKLSLSRLGDRISVSKARAAQFVRAATDRHAGTDEGG